jgi:hypothetical protein
MRSLLFVLAVLGLSGTAVAQTDVALSAAFGWPGILGSGGVSGGTVAGDYFRGLSHVIRAEGEYNALTARGMIDYETARSQFMANSKAWVDTYYELREQNEARRAARLARERHSPETLAAAARLAIPKPLSSESLDPLTGRIEWPEALKAAKYNRPRERLEQLLEIRATISASAAGKQEIVERAREMIETLKDDIREMPVNDYIAARKFLDSLMSSVG